MRIKMAVLGAVLALGVVAQADQAKAFSESLTNRAVATGNQGVGGCAGQPTPARNECVAKALNRMASVISRPDYRQAQRTIRAAAAKVRKARSKKAAAAAVSAARRVLRKATGQAKSHYSRLATVMSKARSVLRS